MRRAGAVVGPRTNGPPSRSIARCSSARGRARDAPARAAAAAAKARAARASPTISIARSASIRPRRSGATENRTFTVDLLLSRLHLRCAREHQSRRRRHGAARAVRQRKIRRTAPYVPPARRAVRSYTGLLRFPCPRADQRARLPRRVPRVSGRELFSRAWRRASSTACPRAGSPFARRGPKARSFRPSRISGSSGRRSSAERDRDPRAAAEPVGRRRVHVHGAAGRRDGRRRGRRSCFRASSSTAFGIAPLTSMFLFDASNRARFDDFRNAVHDSDGLQIVNGRGERLWRPLANPRTLQVSCVCRRQPERLRPGATQALVRRTIRTRRRSTIGGRRCGWSRSGEWGPRARRARRDPVAPAR